MKCKETCEDEMIHAMGIESYTALSPIILGMDLIYNLSICHTLPVTQTD